MRLYKSYFLKNCNIHFGVEHLGFFDALIYPYFRIPLSFFRILRILFDVCLFTSE